MQSETNVKHIEGGSYPLTEKVIIKAIKVKK